MAAPVRRAIEGRKGRKRPTAQRADAIHEETKQQIREVVGDSPRLQRMYADQLEARNIKLNEFFPQPRTRTDLETSTAISEMPTSMRVTEANEILLGGDRELLTEGGFIRDRSPAEVAQNERIVDTATRRKERFEAEKRP